MKSVADGLARQAVVIVGGGALLLGAIYSGAGVAPRPSASRQNIEPPIRVQSIEMASATTSSPVANNAAEPQAKTESQAACSSAPCAQPVSGAKARRTPPRPMVERRPEPVVGANVAAAPAPDPGLGSRLLSSVGLLRDKVVRLVSRP